MSIKSRIVRGVGYGALSIAMMGFTPSTTPDSGSGGGGGGGGVRWPTQPTYNNEEVLFLVANAFIRILELEEAA